MLGLTHKMEKNSFNSCSLWYAFVALAVRSCEVCMLDKLQTTANKYFKLQCDEHHYSAGATG